MLASTGFKTSNENYSGCNPESITWVTSFHQDWRPFSAERGAADMHTPETVTQATSFWGWWTTAVHGYLTVRTMTKIYDVSFNMEWVRDTLDFWNERTFRCIEDCYHMHSCLGATDYSRPFHLHAGEAVGVAMVDSRAWWQTDGPWYELIPSCCGGRRRRWLKWLRKTVLSYPLILYTTHQVGIVLHDLKSTWRPREVLAKKQEFNRCMAYPHW